MADTAVQKFEEKTLESVQERVGQFAETGIINLPKDYSVGNALLGAWLTLQEMKESKTNTPILNHVTKASVANALLDMATQGLSVAKKQGAFIKYGDKLVFQRQYFGTIALAKRYAGMKDVVGNVVYEGDDFQFETDTKTGRKRIVKHTQSIANINPDKIIGAYALVTLEDGSTFLEVMNMAQIKTSWNQGQSKGDSPAHRNFPDQLAIKTVINRALKILVSSSDDSVLMETEDGRTPKSVTIDITAEPVTEEPEQVIAISEVATPAPEPAPVQKVKDKKDDAPF